MSFSFFLHFLLFVSRAKIMGRLYFVWKVSFQIFVAWMGIAAARVEEPAFLKCVLYTRVFLCASCFLLLFLGSLRLRHNVI